MIVNSCSRLGYEAQFERAFGISLTIPQQSISIRELIDRHNSGGKVKSFGVEYTGPDPSITDGIERMDMIERKVYAERLADFVRIARGKMITAREAAQREADRARIIEEYEASKVKTDVVEG